jgi:DNA-binding CsgD family transcriptional regulator
MNDWLKEIKKDIAKFHKTEYAKISDGKINQRVGASLYMSNREIKKETRKKLSKIHKNKEISKEQIEKTKLIKEKIKEEKIKQYTKKEIKLAQKQGTNAKEIANILNISQRFYKEIATYYGIYKSLTPSQSAKLANNKRKIDVYKYPSMKFVKTFNSITECREKLNLDNGNIGKVLSGKRKHTMNYYFEYAD